MTPRIIGSLHDGACKSAEECVCTPVFVLESTAVEQAFEVKSGYHGEVDHTLESRRLGVPAHPGRRAVRVVEVSP